MCKYVRLEETKAPYPRAEYKAECGFRLVTTQGFNPDWNSYDYGKKVHPEGDCMKCKTKIEVVPSF